MPDYIAELIGIVLGMVLGYQLKRYQLAKYIKNITNSDSLRIMSISELKMLQNFLKEI